ncbi:P-loop containing nucleoside triphosphate hydrolase protein [Dimargaris cristalligena]|uniref:P-loop containing nucleoside triphosphate hydrolase protein n=1 Tax=Dimargaris cristalligena TaxID=215637 RepID=A0A4P9ZJJ1_9FUNG|nr:P-loop containing nucleoside triphosphate hydrolase protein [Dimargaris cristalligena]|eukprot:RKP33416.1 P-loop containing nucleoside triphosphate hydrolase protein [Dimargaris cristalligena]
MFLVTIRGPAHSSKTTKATDAASPDDKLGIAYVRGCEVLDQIGEDGKPVEERGKPRDEQRRPTGPLRTFRVVLDANQYAQDMRDYEHGGDTKASLDQPPREDIYETFNLLVRRKPEENNFKAVLETIRDLMLNERVVVPAWLQSVFLGYGDPAGAHYSRLPQALSSIDFRDTFLDLEHVRASFAPMAVEAPGAPTPPYVVKFSAGANASANGDATLQVATYTPPNMGPYPFNVPRRNAIRFTPRQVEAIRSGVNPGLSLIVGPPGTGKTDVAVQIIANLYHNFPDQHILLVTHSNQALNQLFTKIMALDIDERHLLRLGHGEEELETDEDFGKLGRVNSFLEKRLRLLGEVDRLAKSLDVPGDHGDTCETASYFYVSRVLPRWEPYLRLLEKAKRSPGATDPAVERETLATQFPFQVYFQNAPQPLFPAEASVAHTVAIAEGCFHHINQMFTELEEIRPFELLRTNYDRSNYLLTKEARIIAMTCTHAALKRRELVRLGFKYDSVVMEEAAQILEIETLIPLLLQNPEDGRDRLKRVVLIGDHHQLPPIVKNQRFQRYGNMEQSLFTRFMRLGVPGIQLDCQGRARPALSRLYAWRYRQLGDLPNVQSEPRYLMANAGFAAPCQLINVEDYEGQGESAPTPYFYQNVGEAEYVVAVYQYMRLLGYPADRITILTTYNGQKALIRDVLQARCSWHPYFQTPAKITTVDKYQGQQNDYILLSLVRTKAVGHLRDIRRLTVAVSRARLGLYVFARQSLFATCAELAPTLNQLMNHPEFANRSSTAVPHQSPSDQQRQGQSQRLVLYPTETFPSERPVDTPLDPEHTLVVDDVAHLGKVVYEMARRQLSAAEPENGADHSHAQAPGEPTTDQSDASSDEASPGEAGGSGDDADGSANGQEMNEDGASDSADSDA